jgi:hypothetical protein
MRKAGLFLLWMVVVIKFAQIVSLFVGPVAIVTGADGIPVNTFEPDAARTVIAAFFGMGVSRLMICVVCTLVLWRHHSFIPAVFLLLALHDVARELVLGPVRVGAPVGAYVNWTMVMFTLLGIVLARTKTSSP